MITFYKENKGIFARDKYLIKNKQDLEEKITTIKKILNDPRCENVKTTPPFRPFLEEALKLHLEKTKPKPAPADKPLPKFNKSNINYTDDSNGKVIRYNDNNLNIVGSILNNEFFLDLFDAQQNKNKPRSPKGFPNRMLCDLLKHVIKKYKLNRKSKISLEAGNINNESHDQDKLEKYYKGLGFKKDAKESKSTDTEIFSQTIGSFLINCKKFDKK